MSNSVEKNRKLISIIIATYNCGQKIENTLESIFTQNKDLFELIVIDGASTDNTIEYIKKYKNKLTLICEKDQGVFDAFNKGIDLATGYYIYFIGAGDCLRPNILEDIKNFLSIEKPTIVYGSCYLMKQNTIWLGREFNINNFFNENICHQAIFHHKDVFKIIGKYNTSYKISADWFFNLQCFTHKNIYNKYIPYVIADFEGGGLSSNLKNDHAFTKDFPKLLKLNLGIFAYIQRNVFVFNPKLWNFCYLTIRSITISLKYISKLLGFNNFSSF